MTKLHLELCLRANSEFNQSITTVPEAGVRWGLVKAAQHPAAFLPAVENGASETS